MYELAAGGFVADAAPGIELFDGNGVGIVDDGTSAVRDGKGFNESASGSLTVVPGCELGTAGENGFEPAVDGLVAGLTDGNVMRAGCSEASGWEVVSIGRGFVDSGKGLAGVVVDWAGVGSSSFAAGAGSSSVARPGNDMRTGAGESLDSAGGLACVLAPNGLVVEVPPGMEEPDEVDDVPWPVAGSLDVPNGSLLALDGVVAGVVLLLDPPAAGNEMDRGEDGCCA